ncbi:FAD binding domain-containing protein [Candidatus Poriferisodalis sp.]|uniref:FAD binding domain-containing protein n=1 Tax=Candidatus Poriferisodalis sp. TaxID=3101277 RepID=UPI003AF8894C
MRFCRVSSVAEAVDELSRWGNEGCVLAGGTDVMPQYLRGERAPAALIDIGGIDGLRGMSEVGGVTSIGSLVTLRRLATSSLIALEHPALAQAAAAVGAWQTQTVATLGGNVCGAAPTADTLPALLISDAQLALVSKSGRRRLGLEEFLDGTGGTVLRPTELLRSVEIEPLGERCAEGYLKVGRRSAMDRAVVGLALRLSAAPNGTVSDARVAVCGGSQSPHRARAAETAMLGTQIDGGPVALDEAGEELAHAAAPERTEIAQYRRRVLPGLLNRLAQHCVDEILGAGE